VRVGTSASSWTVPMSEWRYLVCDRCGAESRRSMYPALLYRQDGWLWSEIAAMAEAQVQAVRELCDNKQREVEESDPLFGPPLTLTVPDVLRALNGDSDE